MISIIVPIYKAEKFVSRCIESILAQTYKDWELILVDDGSPDNSGKICDDYASKDSRIRVFHKENGGVSSARNLGLDEANGDWIAFIDADDYINECYLMCIEKNNDIIFTNSLILDNRGKCSNGSLLEQDHLDDYKAFIKENLQNEKLRTPWGKLIKKSVIGDLRFPLNQRIGEDTVFVYKLLALAKNVSYSENSIYIWQKGDSADSVKYSLSVIDNIKFLNAILDSYELIGVKSHKTEKFFLAYFFTLVDKDRPSQIHKWFEDKKIASYLRSLYGYKLPLSFSLWGKMPFVMYFIKKIVILFRKK